MSSPRSRRNDKASFLMNVPCIWMTLVCREVRGIKECKWGRICYSTNRAYPSRPQKGPFFSSQLPAFTTGRHTEQLYKTHLLGKPEGARRKNKDQVFVWVFATSVWVFATFTKRQNISKYKRIRTFCLTTSTVLTFLFLHQYDISLKVAFWDTSLLTLSGWALLF